MRVHRSLSPLQNSSLCLLLIYTLAISLFAPFAIRRVVATPANKTITATAIKTPAPVTARSQEQKSRWRQGELLVRFKERAHITKMNALLRANNAQWSGRIRGQSRIERLRLSAGTDPETVAARLRSSEFVDFAEPNYLITADQATTQTALVDDPRFSEQWGLQNIGTQQAGAATTGAKQTVIAVIDSGIDFSHPDLINNQWDNSLEQDNNRDNDGNGFNADLHGWDFVTNSAGISDGQGHGTAIAGIIAAQGNNGIGITGVMWRASLMSLRVLDNTGTGDIATAVEAIDYATTNGAQVINCSWGTEAASQALREAINRAAQRGVVVITSAGNYSRDIETTAYYPAYFDLPNLIAVASTDKTDSLTPSSNWGAMHVSIAAPGTEILTTKIGGDYQTINGTSASAAFVTGVAGLIKTSRPWLNVERTREMIFRGARQVPSLSDKVASKGVISAAGAAEVLNTLSPSEGLEENKDTNSGEHANNGNGRSPQLDNRSGGINRGGSEVNVTPHERMKGAPLPGLPSLDELRGKQPVNPQIPAAIPSTRCSHKNPDCVSAKSRAAIELPSSLLAWSLSFPFKPSNSEDTSGPVSDSPFRLFWSAPASSPSPQPLPQANRTNFALSATATASSAYTPGSYTAIEANNGDRKGTTYWNDAAPGNTFSDWLEIDFQAAKTIDEIDVFSVQDNYANPVEPYEALQFSSYGLIGFTVQYWTGSAWVNVPGGNVTGNNKVWKKLTFQSINTDKIRVITNASGDGYSRLAEVEASGPASPSSSPQNVDWTNIVGVSASGNSLSKTTGTAWDGGAVSLQTIASGNGYVEFTASETNKHRMCGLSRGDTNQSWDDTDYAIYLQDNGYIKVYESGTDRGQFVSYSTNDHLRVSVENGVVKYSKNGTVFYTSMVAPTYPLLVDTSLYSAGATITDAVISGAGPINSFSVERLDPVNRTGSGGVDLLSRNANWSLPILGLKGRAGLDLGLSLSYNSLVWTKSQDGAFIKFDADQGTPSPGFRLGFPTIQPAYFNSQVGKNAYLLITPSGAHVELRQVGASNIYESADSSYLQLIDSGNGTLTLRPMDGSQLTYKLKEDQYRCTEIKDRNGNFITIEYHADGRINTIKDTLFNGAVNPLARLITFVYDEYLNLKEITQNWNGTLHKWATFGWGNQTIQTSFSGLTIIGPQNGTSIPMLTSVGLSDGTYYKFRYNSWGQVDKVTSYAADSVQNGQMMDTHPLNYTSYTLDTSGGQDCPRVAEQRVWAEQWNVFLGNQETVTSFSTVSDHSSGQVTMPDSTIHKEIFATSGWQKGLTTGTEVWSGGLKKKWTTTAYTQDDTNLNYRKNARVIETNVYDSDNRHKRTTINYDLYAAYGLPHYVDEYAADGVTLLRRTYTDYNLNQAYLDRRIIGLPSIVQVSDGTGWVSKIAYYYDAGGDQLQATSSATTQHDNTNYGTGLTVGRGNVTAIARFDVTDITNDSKRLITSIGYDTNGSVLFTRDDLDHQTSFVYADSFSDGVNHHTFAYPTTIKDAENNSSTIKYNYDFGATTRTEGPPPAGHSQGAIQTFEYDGAGRPTRINNLVNDAYQRWVYDAYGAVISYTKVQTGAPETMQVTYFDGAGRVRATGADHPNSAGGYLGQVTYYDIMGRLWQKSNPEEMNSSWTPAGEDAAGWVMTLQAYDWKGRPTVTTNPNGTTKLVTYGGCGCAGGEVVTVRDEVGRERRMTADVLGRPLKTEVLNENQTVYSTTTNTYNARDQITSISEQGVDVTGQTTTITYDGYGRLKTKKLPAQTSATTYVYKDDDTVESVTDARGSVSTFTYNARHLVTGISYTPMTGIAATGAVSFTYDAAGNRTSMTDGSGSVTYTYDRLSRLTAENRKFAGTTFSNNVYTLAYSYNLAGGLTSITDPDSKTINYSYDQTGRMTGITGTSFAGVTQYASNMRYRAWGAAKSASYGDNTALSVSYNERLLPTDMSVTNLLLKHYEYYDDGKLRYTRDNGGSILDRSYTYDHVGRVTAAYSGPLARGEADVDMRPYKFNYTYDAMNHLTSRSGRVWSAPSEANEGTGIYSDNKNTGWSYDADGRLTDSGETQYTYDAAGRAVMVVSLMGDVTQAQTFDATGARTRLHTTQVIYHENAPETTESKTKYFVTSSLLAQVVTELDQSGNKTRTFVYQGSQILAWQQKNGSTETLAWEHRDVSNASVTGAAGAELDPFGSAAGPAFTYSPPVKSGEALEDVRTYPGYSDAISGECRVDGIDTPCGMAYAAMGSGAAIIDPTAPSPNAPGGGGAIPIYTRFCVEDPNYVPGSTPENEPLASTGGQMDCTYDITGYTSSGDFLASNTMIQRTPRTMDQASIDLQDAVRAALKALEKESCRDLFGKDVDPTQLLTALFMSQNNAGVIYLADLGAGTRNGNTRTFTAGDTQGVPLAGGLRGRSRFAGAVIRINSNAEAPFRSGFGDFLEVGASDATYRALLIIHELGHAARRVYNSDSASQINDDIIGPKAGDINKANSQRVYDNCFR